MSREEQNEAAVKAFQESTNLFEESEKSIDRSIETAVGLEKFEHVDLHTSIIVNRTELKVGENLDLEVELANAGKGQAILTQIEKAVPEGFELTVKPELYRVDRSIIDENGIPKSHQPEPVTITVKELGIKGWVAGNRWSRNRIPHTS